MNRIVLRFVAVLICCAPMLDAATPQVDRLIPADAELAIAIRDVPGFKARWTSSSFVGLWEDAAIKAFFAPLHQQLATESWEEKLIEQTGYDFEKLASLFAGGVALYVPNLMELIESFDSEESEDGTDVPLVVMADAGERIADLEALLLQIEEREAEDDDSDSSYVDLEREYRGITMHIEQRIDLDEPKEEASWAVVGSILAMAGSPEKLQEVINSVLDGPETETLLNSEQTGVADLLSGSDAYVYLGLKPLVSVIEEKLTAMLAESNPMGLDAGAVMRALRLDSARGSFISVKQDGKTGRIDYGITMTSPEGVFKMLAFENKPLQRISGIPVEIASFSITFWDFQKAWKAIEDITNAINPMYLAMVGGQFKGWQEAQGLQLDLRGALLENLQPELVTVQLRPDEGLAQGADFLVDDQLTILTISDSQAFEGLVETLKSGLSQGNEYFESREFLDTTIWTAKQPSPDSTTPRFEYAITERHAYVSVGEGRTLEAVLIARSRDDAPSAWDLPEIKRAAALVPAEVAAFAYQATDVWMDRIFRILAFVCTDEDDDELTFCDPTAVPSASVFRKYLGPLISTVSTANEKIVGQIWVMSADGNDS